MKKVFFSTPAIIVAVLIGLITTTVHAAPGIDIVKWISDDGVNWQQTDEPADLIVTEGDSISYKYGITNTGEVGDPALEYTLSDSDFVDPIGSGDLDPGETVSYTATGTAVLGEHENTATVDASYMDEITSELITLSAEDVAYYYGIVSPDTITIDIKPGSDPNSINLRSKGVVPVALLSTAGFDATTILESGEDVYFAGAIAIRLNIEDVDGDGIDDVICHFRTQELDLDENSTDGGVEIGSYDPIVDDIVPSYIGNDTVNIVPKGEAKGHSKSNSSQSTGNSNNGKANGKNK
jgi:hypothetical protein